MSKTNLIQINFVTRDLEKAKMVWNRFLGKVPDWEYTQQAYPAQHDFFNGVLCDCSDVKAAKYYLGKGTLEEANAGKIPPEDMLFIAFWQPGENDTPWKAYLDEHGEGLMDLEFDTGDRKTAYEIAGNLPYHIGYYPHMTYSLVHAKESALTDLNICQTEDNSERIRQIEEDPASYKPD